MQPASGSDKASYRPYVDLLRAGPNYTISLFVFVCNASTILSYVDAQ